MNELLVMRLADMIKMHPKQITGKCAECGHDVGIYPSGQRVLMEVKNVRIVCQVCAKPHDVRLLAPGALLEPFESMRKQ
ncbi:MAG TPA: hypothetical protein VHT00_14130 [Stellaceae bacterium]|jgi:hypothetical protein|nr:hypothetical protein [Stellaceae bacterium]